MGQTVSSEFHHNMQPAYDVCCHDDQFHECLAAETSPKPAQDMTQVMVGGVA